MSNQRRQGEGDGDVGEEGIVSAADATTREIGILLSTSPSLIVAMKVALPKQREYPYCTGVALGDGNLTLTWKVMILEFMGPTRLMCTTS
ncbi:hypothetical protein E2562_016481 [Oryza meyeriana var. granulata]|uniref:Uncharacterized protein n=1 Tax=Oryza meyeriana var. granulata TaxID=110450 RepID=A0A6G1BK23_9ORYZ|nr:hypothetical protein E2562_016481 [Oryza meyeriana var. granulata]